MILNTLKTRHISENITWLIGLFVLSALVLFPQILCSQEKFKFSYDSGVFIGEVGDLMKNSKNRIVSKDSEHIMPTLAEKWNSGRFTKDTKDKIREITQMIYDDNLVNDLAFINFYYAVNYIAYSSLDNKSISNYLIYSKKLYNEKGKDAFKEHVKYSKEFFGKNVLNSTPSMKWCLRCKKYKLPSDSDFIVEMDNGSIVCKSPHDSIMVKQTKGVFKKNDMSFVGTGGVSTWQRFKLDEKRVYAKLSKYTIDLKTVEIFADSALLYNKDIINEPLTGYFHDKLFANSQSANGKFPTFVANNEGADVTDLFKDIVLRGVFGMRGAEFYISQKKNIHDLLLVVKNNDTIVKIETKSLVMRDKKLVSNGVMMRIKLENDSLFHNSVAMQYDNNTREFVFYNADKKAEFAPFFDTYHNINIFSEAVFWNVDNNIVKFKKLMPNIKESKAFFRSNRYFRFAEWERLRGLDDYNPLNVMGEYMAKYKTNVLDVSILVAYFKRNEMQVVSSILQLEKHGYLAYDAEKKIAYPNERMYHALDVLMTNADYDIINIESFTDDGSPNMELDISNCDLVVNGVSNFILSSAKNVNIIPYDKKIIVKNGMNIDFSGKIMAGLFEFHIHNGTFNYNNFAIDLPKVDSLVLYVKKNDKDLTGPNPEYVRLKNVITDVSGVVYVDKVNNKSGKDETPEYPIFDCKKEAKVEYRDSRFVLEPFVINNMFSYNTESIKIGGYFSSDIFPDFRDTVRVMEDYSLGFEHDTGEDGFEMFDGKSKFHDVIHASNSGFYGSGTIDFMTSFIESDHIDFFEDSLHCANGKFEMLSVDEENLSYPYAVIDSADVKMSAKSNQMFINTLNKNMSIYDNSAFKGVACLQHTGFTGKGTFEFDAATVKSDDFKFENTKFEAKAEKLTAKDSIGTDAFITTKYWVSVDFVEQLGLFKKLDKNSLITFPQNEFNCDISNVEWNINDATLTMSDNYNSKLVSLNQKQDELTFNTPNINFDINAGLLSAHNVDTILLADAAVVTSDGIVNIGRDAVIQPLTNSIIMVDNVNKFHRFYDAEVEIKSRNDYLASGKLDFINHDKIVKALNFNNIYVDSMGMTKATCVVDEYDNFLVGNDMLYKGDVKLESTRKGLEFDGDFMLINQCLNDFQWFKSDAIIDPDNVVIPLNDTCSSYNSGMFYDTLNREFFVGFLSNNATYQPHKTVLQLTDELSYDTLQRCYTTSKLSLQTDSCFIVGEGNIDLGFNNQFIQFNSDGKFINDIINNEIKLEMTSSLDFIFNNALLEKMADVLRSSSDTLKVKSLKNKHNIVIDSLNMRWISSLHCFINETPFYLKSILKTPIEKDIEGYILLNYNDIPSLALYLKEADDKWFFFCYQDGLLTSISSDNDYINRLKSIKEKHRHFINKKTGEEFEYSIGDFEEVNNFLQMVGYLRRK